MRLIDADALIEYRFKNPISYNAFVNLVKRMPTAEPPKWIPVSERLPERPGVYLVTTLNREWERDGNEIIQGAKPPKDGYWEDHENLYGELPDGRWVVVRQRVFHDDVWSGYDEIVLAWQPMPKPYKEAEP